MAACLIATGALAQAKQGGQELLVTPAWLATHLHDANLVLLHVGDKTAFSKEHIAGARHIALDDVSSHDMTSGALMLELLPVAQLQEAFESRGISNDSRVVVYFATNNI